MMNFSVILILKDLKLFYFTNVGFTFKKYAVLPSILQFSMKSFSQTQSTIQAVQENVRFKE